VAALKAHETQLPARQVAWETEIKKHPPWTILDVNYVMTEGGTVLTKLADGSVLASSNNPTPETYIITAKTLAAEITGYRLEVMTDPSLPAKGPGRSEGGNFVLNEFKGKLHNIGRFRLSVTTQKPPIQLQSVPENIVKIVDLPEAKRTPQQKEAVSNYYRSLDPELARLQRSLAELVVPADARTMAAQD